MLGHVEPTSQGPVGESLRELQLVARPPGWSHPATFHGAPETGQPKMDGFLILKIHHLLQMEENWGNPYLLGKPQIYLECVASRTKLRQRLFCIAVFGNGEIGTPNGHLMGNYRKI